MLKQQWLVITTDRQHAGFQKRENVRWLWLDSDLPRSCPLRAHGRARPLSPASLLSTPLSRCTTVFLSVLASPPTRVLHLETSLSLREPLLWTWRLRWECWFPKVSFWPCFVGSNYRVRRWGWEVAIAGQAVGLNSGSQTAPRTLASCPT